MGKPPTLQTAHFPRTGASSRWLTITLYVIVVFLYWVALYLYMPTLPTYVQSKSDNLALVGVVLSIYGLWQMMIRLPLGIVADWLGWRKPFIFG
jgi:DHA1 family multidrug resistance protein-like MFS transporter